MSLINYVKTIMNKRLLISESRSDSNRCTPCREKSDQHDTYASHVSPRTLGVCFLRMVSVRDNLLQVINSVGWALLLPRKMAPKTNPARLSDPQVRHPFSLLTQSLK
jgi:hypothetical protein